MAVSVQLREHKRRWAILMVILLMGAGLRFLGIDFGYPHQIHADEHAIVNPAIQMAQSNTLIAPGYERPDNVVKKASAVLYKLFSRVVYATPLLGKYIDRHNDSVYYLITRAYVACLGTLMVYIAYKIGRRFSREAGYLAALLFAVCPLLVAHSHYATSDISLTLHMCLCIMFALRYEESPSHIRLIPMALFAALGTLDKYPGILTCGMLGLTVLLCQRRDLKAFARHALILLLAYAGFLFIISPNLFLDFEGVWARIQVENRSVHLGADGLSLGGNMLYYARQFFSSWNQGGGWNRGGIWLALFLLMGCGYLIVVRKRRNIVFSVLPIWWVLLSTRALHWQRWGLPMYAGALLICAVGTGSAIRALRKRPALRNAALLLFAGLCLFFPMSGSIAQCANMCSDNAMTIAYERAGALGISADNAIFDDISPLYMRGSNGVSWTNHVSLQGGGMTVNALGKRYLIGNDKQYALLEANQQHEPEKYEKYRFLYESMTPFEVISPVLRTSGSTQIPLIRSIRKLMAALIDGEEGYISGIEQRFYDISALPVRAEILSKGQAIGGGDGLVLLKTPLCAGRYAARLQTQSAQIVQLEIIDPGGRALVSQPLFGESPMPFEIHKDCPDARIVLRALAADAEISFDALVITADDGLSKP
jgi:hypothetical protein